MVGVSRFDNHYEIRIQLRSADINEHGLDGAGESPEEIPLTWEIGEYGSDDDRQNALPWHHQHDDPQQHNHSPQDVL